MADTSRLTAAVAVRILNGEKAGDIKVSPVEFSAPKFDWRHMQRWVSASKTFRRGARSCFVMRRHGGNIALTSWQSPLQF